MITINRSIDGYSDGLLRIERLPVSDVLPAPVVRFCAAAAREHRSSETTLFAVGALAGAKLGGRTGEPIGTVVEGMMRCGDSQLAYVVVSEGGVGGLGERLHALHPSELVICEDGVTCDLNAEELQARPALQPDKWPAAIDYVGHPHGAPA